MSAKSRTVCFVCYGNICRSPMAAAIMADIIRNDPGLSQRDIKIISAGTGATGGREAHPNTRQTMKEWGLTLDNHRARLLSGDIVDEADLIVAMDGYVEEDIIAAYPASSGKLCPLNIMDPYGNPLEIYRRCAEKIRENCLSKVLPYLLM